MPLRKDFLGVRGTVSPCLFPANQRLPLRLFVDSVPQCSEDEHNTHHPELCNRMIINEARQKRAEQDADGHDDAENHRTKVLYCIEDK
jgi:hypothetical protein